MRWGARAAVTTLVVLALTSCGLPGSGTVTQVDDRSVPYRLLEKEAPESGTGAEVDPDGTGPQAFWLLEDVLVPEPVDASCVEPAEDVVRLLLVELAGGPPEDARAAGRSTAIAPDSPLSLDHLAEGTAVIEVDPETTVRADRLPAAVGQIVLTVTSAPGVFSVALVSDGEPVQVPLPDGVLTSSPVTAADYADLVSERYDATRLNGCPAT